MTYDFSWPLRSPQERLDGSAPRPNLRRVIQHGSCRIATGCFWGGSDRIVAEARRAAAKREPGYWERSARNPSVDLGLRLELTGANLRDWRRRQCSRWLGRHSQFANLTALLDGKKAT
jgi:hypothetical protein